MSVAVQRIQGNLIIDIVAAETDEVSVAVQGIQGNLTIDIVAAEWTGEGSIVVRGIQGNLTRNLEHFEDIGVAKNCSKPVF